MSFVMLALVTLAQAGAPPAGDASKWDQHWDRIDHRAKRTYQVGAGMYVGGMGAQLLPGRQFEGYRIAGGLASAVGVPMMLGSSVRSSTALQERGAESADATLGYVGWALYAGAFGVAVASVASTDPTPLTLTSEFMYLGSVVCGGLQYGRNRNVREELARKDATSSAKQPGADINAVTALAEAKGAATTPIQARVGFTPPLRTGTERRPATVSLLVTF
jgi:hypothetical protein